MAECIPTIATNIITTGHRTRSKQFSARCGRSWSREFAGDALHVCDDGMPLPFTVLCIVCEGTEMDTIKIDGVGVVGASGECHRSPIVSK